MKNVASRWGDKWLHQRAVHSMIPFNFSDGR